MADDTIEGTGADTGASTATATDTGTAAPEQDPTFKGSTFHYTIGVFLIALFVFLVYTVVGSLANVQIDLDIPFLSKTTPIPEGVGPAEKAATVANITANETVKTMALDDRVEITQITEDTPPLYEEEREAEFNYG
ncbi:hypothetical protein V5799_016107 [Amblyomma americanum]|uniref:Uncharacterized protein n=1 Tax=Amblyomma americanum TaxID=6943 RepID=A0AAQ4F798_AMBAM